LVFKPYLRLLPLKLRGGVKIQDKRKLPPFPFKFKGMDYLLHIVLQQDIYVLQQIFYPKQYLFSTIDGTSPFPLNLRGRAGVRVLNQIKGRG